MKRNSKIKAFPDVVFPLPKRAERLAKEIIVGSFSLNQVRSGAERYGINENDFVVVFRTYAFTEKQLSVWRVIKDDERLCGIAYENFGEISINFCNGKIRRFKKNELEYIGAVVGVIKPHTVDLKSVLVETETE